MLPLNSTFHWKVKDYDKKKNILIELAKTAPNALQKELNISLKRKMFLIELNARDKI